MRPWEGLGVTGSSAGLPSPSAWPSCHPYPLGCPLPQGRAQTLPDKARASWRVSEDGPLCPAWLTEGHRAPQSPGQARVTVGTCCSLALLWTVKTTFRPSLGRLSAGFKVSARGLQEKAW